MHGSSELLVGWADDAQTLDKRSLTRLLLLGAGASKLLHLKGKVGGFVAGRPLTSDRGDWFP